MRLWNLLLLLSLVPAADAGTMTFLTPLNLQVTDGTTSNTVTGGPSDLSVSEFFSGGATGWSGDLTLAIPGTYNSGFIQEPSPLSFGFTNLSFYCLHAGGCTDELDVNFSFALQLVSGFSELAGQPMTSMISLNSSYLGAATPNASVTLQGSFLNSLSVASNYLRSFALAGFGFGNNSVGSSFTNAGAGNFGPAGNLGVLNVSGNIRLTGFANDNEVMLHTVDYTFDGPTAVPEPGTMALALLGIGACVWLIRRRAIPAIALRRSSPRPAGPAILGAVPVPPGIRGGSGAAPEVPRN